MDFRLQIGDFRLGFLWVLILITISFSFAVAQDGSFAASVDRNRVVMGERIEITFSLNGSGKNFQPPDFKDFLVLSGPNQSTSMQIINGAISQSISYSYILQPRSEGKFTIGTASIEFGGKKLQSNSITIEIAKGVQQPKQQPSQSQEDASISKQIGDNLFIRVSVDKSSIYQGEQITATYKLYTRVNITNYGVSKVPSFTGFWNQEIDLPKNPQFGNEVLNGIQYRVATLKRTALFAQQNGTLEIDPMEADFVVQVQTKRRGGDVFDQFFNDPFFGNVRNVEYKAKSNNIKIHVRPLPPNSPPRFSGAVGKFSSEFWLDKNETKSNEPVTLKVKISGRGNLKLIQPLKINFPNDLEVYEPKISDNISQGTNIISGSRTFEYLLIPRRQGNQKISSFSFAYFDPDKKEYVSITSPDFNINVTKGTEIVSAPVAGLSKEEIKLLGQDIRFIKSGTTSFKKQGESFFGSLGFFILLLSPMFLFVGFISYIRHYEKISGDVVRLKSRKATKIAKRRLVHAEKFLSQKKREEFYSAISQALWGYVGDKLGIPLSDLSQDSIKTTLTSRKVNDASIEKLINTINHCEFARFAPSSGSHEMEMIYKNTIELITSIEEELR
ncbi:MAG: BatD family protein [Bacteroidota bacterium]|nr:BatD family protein [Bacteroidota bacterium]